MARRVFKSIFTDDHKVLLSLLKETRKQAGLRQSDLADRLGTIRTVVSNYETGERRLDILELRNVCKACGITLEDFARTLRERLGD